MADPVGLEQLDDAGDLLDRAGLPGMHGEPEAVLARSPEEPAVVGDAERRGLRTGDIDADHPAIPPRDRLLDDDLVELVREGPVERRR